MDVANRPLVLGPVLAAMQIASACLIGLDQAAPYARLAGWDGGYYAWIARTGYETANPLTAQNHGNIGFFPGYPLATRLVVRATGLPVELALLVAAQVASAAAWTYFLLLLRQSGVSRRVTAIVVLAVLVHPAAFILIASYSESLFLVGLLGYVYWADRPGRSAWVMAAIHGTLMTGTRLIGLPLVVYPLARAVANGTGDRGWLSRAALATVASLGGLGFFAYCQFAFGRWDLYLRTQQAGWGIRPDYFFMFNVNHLRLRLPGAAGLSDPALLNANAVPMMLIAFAASVWADWRLARRRRAARWRRRAVLYVLAWLAFYIAASGVARASMMAMMRHSLVPYLLLLLAWADRMAEAGPPPWPARKTLALATVGAALLAWHVAMMVRFTHGLVVA